MRYLLTGYGCPDSRELLKSWKADKIMMEQKFGTFSDSWRLSGIGCAKKIGQANLQKQTAFACLRSRHLY
jgi:hypothetical protein